PCSISISNVVAADATCNMDNGTITVTANCNGCGMSGIEYSKDNGASWQSSNIFSGLAAGSYDIKVRDAGNDNCSDTYGSNPVQIAAVDNDCDGFTVAQGDCNDNDANEFPGQTWYIDADGDDYGGSSVVQCARPANGFLLSELSGNGTDDCNDNDPNEYPGQPCAPAAARHRSGDPTVVKCARA